MIWSIYKLISVAFPRPLTAIHPFNRDGEVQGMTTDHGHGNETEEASHVLPKTNAPCRWTSAMFVEAIYFSGMHFYIRKRTSTWLRRFELLILCFILCSWYFCCFKSMNFYKSKGSKAKGLEGLKPALRMIRHKVGTHHGSNFGKAAPVPVPQRGRSQAPAQKCTKHPTQTEKTTQYV